MNSLGTLNVKSKRGFSLVEVLITLAIFVLLGAVVLPVAGDFYTSSSLEQENNNLLTAVRSARTRSFARLNNSAHGIFFQPSLVPPRYTAYQGPSYAGRNLSYDVVTTLPNTFSLTVSPSITDLNFAAGTAAPNGRGTITLTHSSQGNRQVVVNKFGGIYEN